MPRILVADDEPMVREALVKILKAAGYDVAEARTGKEACQLAAAQRPDVMLLDVDMPVMNGFEALQALRNNPETKDLPVIMLTSTPAVVGEQAAMMYGVEHYLSKPWRADVVEAAVRIVLRNVRREDAITGTRPEEPLEDAAEDTPPPKVRKLKSYLEVPRPKRKPKPKLVDDDPLFPGSLADTQG